MFDGYFDDFDMDLAVINWTQGFADGKAGYAVGRLASERDTQLARRSFTRSPDLL